MQDVVIAFNDAINAHDLDRMSALMTDDHRFIDSAGQVIHGKLACIEGWRGFFAAFPDYRNHFASLVVEGQTVIVHGSSSCSVPALSGPARWPSTWPTSGSPGGRSTTSR